MAALHAIPAGGSTVADPARTAAIHAIRASIEDRLDHALVLVDEHLSGRHPVALDDARDTLSIIRWELDALEQLGAPMPVSDYYADALT
jgi:hypothetical protein